LDRDGSKLTNISASTQFVCRSCGSQNSQLFVDLGRMPLANSYLRRPDALEPTYPLRVNVCQACLLVQTEDCVDPGDMFSSYAYLSSYSDTWVRRAESFVNEVAARFKLTSKSHVVEVASNDGYLLKNFVRLGIPCLGIEAAQNVAAIARDAGVPTEAAFFGANYADQLRQRGKLADLVVANNVLAHVPDINDFVMGLATLLSPSGVLSVEFPHFLNLIQGVQFDTIYHEHFSYISFLAVESCFSRNGLHVWDAESVPTHGGSLRLFLQRSDTGLRSPTKAVDTLRSQEATAHLDSLITYEQFAKHVEKTKDGLLNFLRNADAEGKTVAAYGAAAKGSTLLNYAGVGRSDIPFCVDRSKEKQGKFMPGSHIPILSAESLLERQPNYVLILPWNLRDEIADSISFTRDWNCKLFVAVPEISQV
jgi:SAM-dependent methyltransferase